MKQSPSPAGKVAMKSQEQISRPRRSALAAVVFLSLLVLPAGAQQPSRAELLRKSSIVFAGTVTKTGTVSFSGVPASPQTLVVQVDTVFEKPAAVALAVGDKVTVQVKDPSAFRPEVQATFYCKGWIYGEGLALREVGHEILAEKLSAAAAEQKQKTLAQTRRELSDAKLRARIQAADVVLAGRVVAVRPATMMAMDTRREPISEHAPNWQEAVIRVESSIKGAEAGQEIVVRFPGSNDVAWYNVPKFKKGQEGTFFLKQDAVSGAPKALHAGATVDAYTALNPKDVLPKQAAARVRALSKQ